MITLERNMQNDKDAPHDTNEIKLFMCVITLIFR